MRRMTPLLAIAMASFQLAATLPARQLPASPGFGLASIKPLKKDHASRGSTAPAETAVAGALLQDPTLYGGAPRHRQTETLA